jgi:threonine dehydrogenase-like Zn-dependent dehydrogenase
MLNLPSPKTLGIKVLSASVGHVVVFEAPRRVGLHDYPDPVPGPREVRLATLYSGISAGTELTAYRGSNPYLRKRWETERRLFISAEATLSYPVEGWGYEEVGRVEALGPDVSRPREGDVVCGAWGHRSSYVMSAGDASGNVLGPNVNPINGVFSRIAAIALNTVIDADVHVGETVAIFGQGVPGLIATQLAALNGASVIAIDRVEARLELARRFGAFTIDARAQSPAEVIKDRTGGLGADVSIELSGSYVALNEAIRSTAYNSRVVASGFFQGEGAGLYLGEEFHHNRIRIVCSQISGVGSHVDHRWDEPRLRATVLRLQAEGRLDFQSLVSHVIPVERAADAFRLLDEEPESAVQVILEF